MIARFLSHFLGVIPILALGCRTFSSPDANDSMVKHTFGETSRKTLDSFSCSPAMGDLKEGQIPPGQHEILWKYLKAQFDIITQSNPKTFEGNFDPAKFCLNGTLNWLYGINASSAIDGTIHFHPEMLLALEDDAQIAAVMAHELAHRTMGHLTKVGMNKKMAEDPVYVEAFQKDFESRAKLEKLLKEVEASLSTKLTVTEKLAPLISAFNTSILQLVNYDLELRSMNNFDRKDLDYEKYIENYLKQTPDGSLANVEKNITNLLSDEEKERFFENKKVYFGLINQAADAKLTQTQNNNIMMRLSSAKIGIFETMTWEEVEADEVGYELYLRAGYIPSQYSNSFMKILNISAPPNQNEMNRGHGECEIPLYTNLYESHPSLCWRYKHITIHEQKDHETQYDEIVAQGERKSVAINNGEDLINLKRWLREQKQLFEKNQQSRSSNMPLPFQKSQEKVRGEGDKSLSSGAGR